MSDAIAGEPGKAAADDLDAAYAEIRRDPYIFTWAGREWSLPHLSDLDYRTMLKIEQRDELGVPELVALFAEMFTEDQREAWAQTEVPLPVVFMLFDRLMKHSGAQSGESRASKRSSKSTGVKSRPTSAASTTGSASPKPSSAGRVPRKGASPRGRSST
jgi:hypothetical protein